jgi:hypothetical protein
MEEISRSLHTKEPAEARRRCLTATIGFGNHDEHPAHSVSNAVRPGKAAAAFFVQMAKELDRPREFHPVHYGEDLAYRIELSALIDEMDRCAEQIKGIGAAAAS